jgi:hypothetical protein
MAKTVVTQESTGKRLSLFALAKGEIDGITSFVGGCLAEAACICLEDQKHASGVKLKINGAITETLELLWDPATAQMCRCWADDQEATEFGACGIAISIIYYLTGSAIQVMPASKC